MGRYFEADKEEETNQNKHKFKKKHDSKHKYKFSIHGIKSEKFSGKKLHLKDEKAFKKPFAKVEFEEKIGSTDEKPWKIKKYKGKRKEIKPSPVPKEKLDFYERGEGFEVEKIKNEFERKKLKKREQGYKFSSYQSAKTEVLLPEDTGYLVAEGDEVSTQFTQKQIVDAVDITSATKHFELELRDFGPYRMNYTRNGRYLLIGSKRGHVAAMDWITKHLMCEINVMEEVVDVRWLHIETMFAVAQKLWVYIYDNQGVELHCLKHLNQVLRLEFLPYHFLLAASNEEGFLSWLDISIGKMISQYNTKMGRLNIMAQNPYNAVLCLGHAKGIVSMWTPNMREPVAKMLCHSKPLQAVAIDPKGMFMATSGLDRRLKIWDIRMLNGPMQDYLLHSSPTSLAFSQRGLLATGSGNVVEVYKDCCTETAEKPYLRHRLGLSVTNMQFCPYEDVLGVASGVGFTSLIVPGSGEPNFDALESNPYQSKSQRKEAEVKALLEKIPPELITLEPSTITEVDIPTMKDKIEAKKNLLYVKPPKVDYTPRNKGKNKRGTAKIARNKQIVREEKKREFLKAVKSTKEELNFNLTEVHTQTQVNLKQDKVLDRFRPKKKN